uniref:Uncharacterized protein n=1 Tax=Mycena chlorophos TaxID=658473 RepID=A0ABQ0KVV5_MYCCL|nr:predicted protein [Mycena chlorophos]
MFRNPLPHDFPIPVTNTHGLARTLEFLPNLHPATLNNLALEHRGIPLLDFFLREKFDTILQPEARLLPVWPGHDGPLITEFVLRQLNPRKEQVLAVDVVYGNCAHRSITRFELGYALASTFKSLIPSNLWDRVLLVNFVSPLDGPGKRFRAVALLQ